MVWALLHLMFLLYVEYVLAGAAHFPWLRDRPMHSPVYLHSLEMCVYNFVRCWPGARLIILREQSVFSGEGSTRRTDDVQGDI